MRISLSLLNLFRPLFKRNKKPLEVKIRACVRYWLGLSLRRVARLLGVSHQAVADWFRAQADWAGPPKNTDR